MGEAYGDVSNSSQTPQMKKVFWTGTRESVVLRVYVYVCVYAGEDLRPYHTTSIEKPFQASST